MPSPVSAKILQVIDKKGNSQEKQMTSRWRTEISAFLDAYAADLLKGHCQLEIGLEHALSLKLVVKKGILSPVLGLKKYYSHLPPGQRRLTDEILSRQLAFHAGIKVTPRACETEIYCYEHPDLPEGFWQECFGIPPLAKDLKATAYGISSSKPPAAYLSNLDNPYAERLLTDAIKVVSSHLGFNIEPYTTGVWDHLKLSKDRIWQPNKFAIELAPAPLELVNAIWNRYPMPHFSYLNRRHDYSSAAITGTLVNGVSGVYFTA